MPSGNNNNTTLTWDSGSSSKSLNSNTTRFASDAISIDPTALMGAVQISVDNSGTPAIGDTVNLWISWSVDASLFDTEEHAEYLDRVDTYPTNDPGEDPVVKTYDIIVSNKRAFKILSRANQGASRAITITGKYNERRA